MKRCSLIIRFGALSAGMFLLASCASTGFLTPNPPGGSESRESHKSEKFDPARYQGSGSAPETATAAAQSAEATTPAATDTAKPAASAGAAGIADTSAPATPQAAQPAAPSAVSGPNYISPCTTVRVALMRELVSVSLYAVGTYDVVVEGKGTVFSFKGPLQIKCERNGAAYKAYISQLESKDIALPCTLVARDPGNVIEVGDHPYRGSLIFISEHKRSFSVINKLSVEDYLCGVVSLEIGKLPEKDIEAVKAQAIAARTYAYRKITEKANDPFDMLATLADQVYGGTDAECPVSNRAVKQTANKVLVYGDSLVLAYYHSTCGGKTANVEDVWDKPAAAYLKSIDDCDGQGVAYCAGSKYFAWDETWSTGDLSQLAAKYSKSVYPKNFCTGTISDIRIFSRYACGRIQVCDIETNAGKHSYGGDKLRFVLRRNTKDSDILRSANFTLSVMNPHTVRLHGQGYGHGVGMCQMGAIGRARAGKKYDEILAAYYPGTDMKLVVTGTN